MGAIYAPEQDQFAHEFDWTNDDHIRAVTKYNQASPIMNLLMCLHTHGTLEQFQEATKKLEQHLREDFNDL